MGVCFGRPSPIRGFNNHLLPMKYPIHLKNILLQNGFERLPLYHDACMF